MSYNNKPTLIKFATRIPPSPYLYEGWETQDGLATIKKHKSQKAVLLLALPASQDLYFMAEVSSTPSEQYIPPMEITIKVNNHTVGEWTVSSPTITDKLVHIPASFISRDSPNKISFEVTTDHASAHLDDSFNNQGIQFHSITVDTNLNAYLDELQTGYNWAGSVRDDLLDTIERVLFYFDNLSDEHVQIKSKLLSILNDPYVRTKHEAQLIFNQDYFRYKSDKLKEGIIHQEIRSWVAALKKLQKAVISAGNYATSRPELKCFSPRELQQLIQSHLIPKDKINQLRQKNSLLNNLEILLKKETLDSTPPNLYLDITNTCNFRCKMCYQSSSHFLQTSLVNQHMELVIGILPFIDNITIAGLGEPLLAKNLDLFSEAAKRYSCNTTVITNGSLIAKRIDSLQKFNKVSISFDGATPETFETLRNRSNLQQITKNIALLREKAPQLIIAFSVVVSRANLDEIADIFQLAGKLGVNEVNLTPMEHIPTLQLKKSDVLLFQDQIAKAEKIAHRHGITITNSVTPENFSTMDDTPQDKKQLLSFINSLPAKEEQSYNLERITSSLLDAEFCYYPAPVVFMLDSWPPVNLNHTHTPEPQMRILPFNKVSVPNKTLEELDALISERIKEIKSLPGNSFSAPYCLDPWKLNYVKSNGESRLCCHADIKVGDLGRNGKEKTLNSEIYQHIRLSMFGLATMLPECKRCRAADRFMGLESLQETCRSLDIACKTPSQQ